MDRALLERAYREQQRTFAVHDVQIEREVNLALHFGKSRQVTTITGVRRCGKSTLLKQISKKLEKGAQILYATFDDPRFATFSTSDFETLYEIWLSSGIDSSKAHYLFFDEVQNVEGWERWVDFFSKRPHTKVFITGSNAALLSSELSTLLTGRHQDLHLTPLALGELFRAEAAHNKIEADTIEERALALSVFKRFELYGGFPRVYLEQNIELLNQYYADIIERDILRRLPRTIPRYMLELGTILASESTRLFNRSSVARTLGLKDQVTVGKYAAAFTATYLYKELRAFYPSVRRQLRSLSKFYCVDHVLARQNGLSAELGAGSTLELMVHMELLRLGVEIYYWNSKNGFEADFLLVERRKPFATIQVAYSIADKSTKDREVRALVAAGQELGVKELYIITMYESGYLTEEGIHVLPFYEFALKGLTKSSRA